jgi:S1-C subfamily serine protease
MLQLFSRFRLIALPVLTALMLSNCSNIVAPEEKAEFSSMIPDLKKQCYLIGIKIDEKMYGIGSGFAISNKRIMTNAHVVKGLVEIAEKYGTEGYSFVAVRDGGRVGHEYSFELDSFAIHPEYNTQNNYTYDFGIITIKYGTLTDICEFEQEENLYAIREGDEIYTIGFPGETGDQNTIQPIATYKNGSVSALRPFDQNLTASNQYTNVVIQHNLNTTGGTSGSPIFNRNGKVIAINCSAEFEFIKNSDGTITRIPVGDIAYAIRIDQRTSINNCFLKAFSSIEKVPQYANLTIKNNTTINICYLYISQSSSDTWGNDILNGSSIPSGGSFTIKNIPAGEYDLKVLNANRNRKSVLMKKAFEGGYAYTWTINSLEVVE